MCRYMAFPRWALLLFGLLSLSLLGFHPAPLIAQEQPPTDSAYFRVGFQGHPAAIFVIKLTNLERIQEARALLATGGKFVAGTIILSPASYNPGWSYHFDPETIEFAEAAIEVCDAIPDYVEEHLDEVGGAFLPGNIWCPWSSYLMDEVSVPSLSQVYLPNIQR